MWKYILFKFLDDHSRVKLGVADEIVASDYINASVINVCKLAHRRFIAILEFFRGLRNRSPTLHLKDQWNKRFEIFGG